jgi:signal transduction histidine kinase
LRLANDRFRLLSHAEGVPGGALRAMFVDRGALWLGSYGGGLARWKDGRISHVDSSLGLYSDAISCMLGDGQGNLWLNSNRGAFRLRLADLDGLADGGSEPLACIAARSPESGGRGGTVTGKGTILFATTDGLGRIDPARVSAAAVAPGIELKSCIVDDVGHDVRSDVRVAPGRRELVFRFDGLSLSEPTAVHYRYRLIGLDPGWREGGNAGIARYTSVPPGEYRFEVLARSYDGVWSAQPAAVDLTLEPFVHERWWFKFTVAGIVIGLVCCAFFARSRAARRRQRALQHEVDLRTKAEDSLRKLTGELIRAQEDERRRVALELHDDLGQRLALLGVSLDVLARERTPTATSMRALADSVRSLSSDVHGLSHRLHSTKLDKLGLRAALELLCQELSDRHEIVIVFESKVEGLRVAREIELTLYRITQEALNNVLHHSDATSARVVLDPAGEALRLTVEDDGAGFDPEDGAKGGGIGLQGMRERTYLVGGNLTVVSAPGEGTRIVVTVPAQLRETETQREGVS